MKITVSQLRRIIREEVEKNLIESSSIPLKDGGVVNRDSGEWLEIDSLPSQYLDHVEIEMGYTTLPNEQFEELRGELKGLSAGKQKKQWKAPFQLNRESPDPQDVHDEFLKLRDYDGEVPLKMLAAGLGVEPNQIDWNGTGLRVINGVVTELIGDPPYRTDM